jgi:hypothetical protein
MQAKRRKRRIASTGKHQQARARICAANRRGKGKGVDGLSG